MDAIENLLTRGVDTIYPTRELLEKALRSGEKLKLYQGFDPTGSQLHIGHAVALRKLREFQNLEHEVIFLIGDFTAMIGDPTGKMDSRKMLTKEEVLKNAENYKEQAGRILQFDGDNPVKIKYNSEWLGKVSALEFLQLSHHLTYQQVVERDMFQKRMNQGQDVYMNEFLYPVMQAYDSVAMDVDLEIGGTDQMFNMMMGRKLMRNIKQKEKYVMTVPLLTDANGVKIGKTEGNVIGLTDPPNEFYSKIMSLGDDAIIPCFTLLTDTSQENIEDMTKNMKNGFNPMTYKKTLAFELTKQFNDQDQARDAQHEWEAIHQTGDIHWMTSSLSSLPTIQLDTISYQGFISGASIAQGTVPMFVASKSKFRDLQNDGAIKIIKAKTEEVIKISGDSKIKGEEGDILRIGPKKNLKIKK